MARNNTNALAAVAVSGAAFAQATITGTFNVDLQNTIGGSATVGMGDAIIAVGTTEDLGGGLSAAASTTFQTKAGRGGTVSNNGWSFGLKGGFGGITLKNYLNGATGLSAGVSAENDMTDVAGAYTFRTRLQYDLPTMVEGLSVAIRRDNTGTAASLTNVDSFDTTKYSITYATGPVSVNTTGSTAAGAKNDYTVSYDAGVAAVSAYWADGQTEFAVTAPMGAVKLGLHSVSAGTEKGLGVVASYALSKRTAVSVNFVNQNASATAATKGTNYRIRVAHSF